MIGVLWLEDDPKQLLTYLSYLLRGKVRLSVVACIVFRGTPEDFREYIEDQFQQTWAAIENSERISVCLRQIDEEEPRLVAAAIDDLAREFPTNLLVLDLSLDPVKQEGPLNEQGTAVARHLARLRPDVPVVWFTQSADVLDRPDPLGRYLAVDVDPDSRKITVRRFGHPATVILNKGQMPQHPTDVLAEFVETAGLGAKGRLAEELRRASWEAPASLVGDLRRKLRGVSGTTPHTVNDLGDRGLWESWWRNILLMRVLPGDPPRTFGGWLSVAGAAWLDKAMDFLSDSRERYNLGVDLENWLRGELWGVSVDGLQEILHRAAGHAGVSCQPIEMDSETREWTSNEGKTYRICPVLRGPLLRAFENQLRNAVAACVEERRRFVGQEVGIRVLIKIVRVSKPEPSGSVGGAVRSTSTDKREHPRPAYAEGNRDGGPVRPLKEAVVAAVVNDVSSALDSAALCRKKAQDGLLSGQREIERSWNDLLIHLSPTHFEYRLYRWDRRRVAPVASPSESGFEAFCVGGGHYLDDSEFAKMPRFREWLDGVLGTGHHSMVALSMLPLEASLSSKP